MRWLVLHTRGGLRRFVALLGIVGLVSLGVIAVVTTAANAQTTIVIDGSNDFGPTETFSGADGSTWYFASDADQFYFGLSLTDLSLSANDRFLTLYLDTDPQPDPLTGSGSTMGVLYNTQQPTLPMRADYHLRWRLDDSFESVLSWSGSSWNTIPSGLTGIVNRAAQYVEFSIPRNDLSLAGEINLVGSLVMDTSGAEATFAFVPGTTSAGYDPNPVEFLQLQLYTPSAVPLLSGLGLATLAGLAACLGARSIGRRAVDHRA